MLDIKLGVATKKKLHSIMLHSIIPKAPWIINLFILLRSHFSYEVSTATYNNVYSTCNVNKTIEYIINNLNKLL